MDGVLRCMGVCGMLVFAVGTVGCGAVAGAAGVVVALLRLEGFQSTRA